MSQEVLIGLASILVLGISAQWVAWRLKVPSIIILLFSGFLAGPITGYLNPTKLLGDLLFPIVSLLVAIIVFEGGMSLRLTDLKEIGKDLRNIIIFGTLATFVVIAVSGVYILKLDTKIAILFGAMMVITGPTVIVPLLRHVQLSRYLGSLIRWEGILIAPVGTILIVLVYQFLFSPAAAYGIQELLFTLFKTLFIGGLIGFNVAFFIMKIIRSNWAPDFLQEVITLMLVISSYTMSNFIQSDSGLIAVVILGVLLANQKQVAVRHIIVFKENLRVLAISSLFIILSSQLSLEDLFIEFQPKSWVFMMVLIFVARPLPVFLSTVRSALTLKEKLFISWMAPRGIVTASIASLFALRLMDSNVPNADQIVPLSFLVIIVTVSLYGFTAEPLQNYLKLSNPKGSGLVIIGANNFAIQLANVFKSMDIDLFMVDTNKNHVIAARMENHDAYNRSVFSDQMVEEIRMGGIGALLALTSSDEVNMISTWQYADVLGREKVYRLIPDTHVEDAKTLMQKFSQGAYLFGKGINYGYLMMRLRTGSSIKAFDITSVYTYKQFKEEFGKRAIPLFVVTPNNDVKVIEIGKKTTPKQGDRLIALV